MENKCKILTWHERVDIEQNKAKNKQTKIGQYSDSLIKTKDQNKAKNWNARVRYHTKSDMGDGK